MSMIPFVDVAAHVITLSAIAVICTRFAMKPQKQFSLICLDLLGPLTALLLVLKAETLAATFSTYSKGVSELQINLAAIIFLFFYLLMRDWLEKKYG